MFLIILLMIYSALFIISQIDLKKYTDLAENSRLSSMFLRERAEKYHDENNPICENIYKDANQKEQEARNYSNIAFRRGVAADISSIGLTFTAILSTFLVGAYSSNRRIKRSLLQVFTIFLIPLFVFTVLTLIIEIM